MVSPDLPGNDNNDRHREFQPPPSHELPMHGNAGLDFPEDDIEMAEQQQPPPAAPADQETNNAPQNDAAHNPYVADGYHPLSFEPMAFDSDDADGVGSNGDADSDDDDDDDGASSVDEVAFDQMPDDWNDDEPAPSTAGPENTVDRDLLRQVWNQPRPAESDIVIDASKSEEIKSAMSTVSLGLAGVRPPDWASVVPESKWIEELLQKVRNQPSAQK